LSYIRRLSPIVLSFIVVLTLLIPAGANEVVTFWYYGAQSDFDVLEVFARDFEAENPGIKIEVVNVPYSSEWEKWAVAAAGGSPPDASMGNFGIFRALGDVLEPLERYAEASGDIRRESFFPAHWDAAWYGGHLLALPFRANAQVILYDKQAFDESGIGDIPHTWAELQDHATRLTRRTGDNVDRWGFSFRNAQLNRTANHFAQRNGWQPFDHEYTSAYYTDEKLIETLSFLNGMVVNGVAAIQGMPGVGSLASQRVAMLNDGPWALANIFASNPNFEVGAFVPPAGPSGEQPYANMGGENLVMFKDSKNKEAAWKWLTYLAYERNADYNKMTGAFFPVVTYAATDPHWFESEVWSAVLKNYEEGRLPLGTTPCGIRLASVDAYDQALADIFNQRSAIGPALATVQAIAQADIVNPEFLACLGR